MATGEGKTLVATLPMYLNALSGRGVHLVTVNDYLALRDSQWMGKIFEFHGLTIGVILQPMDSRNYTFIGTTTLEVLTTCIMQPLCTIYTQPYIKLSICQKRAPLVI